MKIINASYEIITDIDGDQILIEIEKAARTCYKSEGKIEIGNKASNGELIDREPKSAKILIKKLIARGHFAMLEFGGMITVRFTNDRGVSHEEVRHRLCSFAQESTRYCNYSEDGKIGEVTYIDIKQHLLNPAVTFDIWFNHMLACEVAYNAMISNGESPQIARSVLPNSLKTEINIGANIREWREIFRQRISNAAHPQMREVMIPLLKDFQRLIPILFDDIIV